MKTDRVCIRFSGLTFRFQFPNPIRVPEDFTDLLCSDCDFPDEEFTIQLLNEPLRPDGVPFRGGHGALIYPTKEGWLRIYAPLIAEDGCQVACLLCSDGKNILYYPASLWDYYSDPLHLLHLIAGEVLLLRHNALLLHSSLVMLHGRTVLFSGPSGAGKSTQAEIWRSHLDAQVLNGDRSVIMEKDGVFFAGGSPWCGTSSIRRPEQAPIAGIFLVRQADRNAVTRLSREALVPLLSQITLNSWDPAFMEKATDLVAKLMASVPIYRLDCRPDTQAADLAHQTLFPKEAAQ